MAQPTSKLGILLKVLFGAAIFGWMTGSGKLNLAQVAHSLSNWPMVVGIAGCAFSQVAITTWRWKMLLKAQEIRLSFRVSWALVMIGMLFNVVIPGAVGGDLIKGYYITRAASGRKANAATSIVMDRVLGLIGLLFLGAVMVVVNFGESMRRPATRSLGLLTIFSFLGGIAVLYAALMAGGGLSRWNFLPAVVRKVFGALHEYRRHGSIISAALALSVANQCLTCLMYFLALRGSGVSQITASQFFLVVPLGMVTAAIPISPGGIGVGQAAFFGLFRIVAPAYASAGAQAVTILQVVFLMVCLSGLYWCISYRQVTVEGAGANKA